MICFDCYNCMRTIGNGKYRIESNEEEEPYIVGEGMSSGERKD